MTNRYPSFDYIPKIVNYIFDNIIESNEKTIEFRNNYIIKSFNIYTFDKRILLTLNRTCTNDSFNELIQQSSNKYYINRLSVWTDRNNTNELKIYMEFNTFKMRQIPKNPSPNEKPEIVSYNKHFNYDDVMKQYEYDIVDNSVVQLTNFIEHIPTTISISNANITYVEFNFNTKQCNNIFQYDSPLELQLENTDVIKLYDNVVEITNSLSYEHKTFIFEFSDCETGKMCYDALSKIHLILFEPRRGLPSYMQDNIYQYHRGIRNKILYNQ